MRARNRTGRPERGHGFGFLFGRRQRPKDGIDGGFTAPLQQGRTVMMSSMGASNIAQGREMPPPAKSVASVTADPFGRRQVPEDGVGGGESWWLEIRGHRNFGDIPHACTEPNRSSRTWTRFRLFIRPPPKAQRRDRRRLHRPSPAGAHCNDVEYGRVQHCPRQRDAATGKVGCVCHC
jgi:hypothetical protein